MISVDDRSCRRVFLALAAISLLGILSCSVIAGPEEGGIAAGEGQVHLQYFETLRNQASLKGRSFQQADYTADPTTSLVRPSSVFADPFRVYVTDAYTSGTVSAPRIFIFDRGSQTVTILPTPVSSLEGRLLNPTGIAASPDQMVFVADGPQAKVFGYDRSGVLLMVFGKAGELTYPAALAVDPRRNRLYIADSHAHRIRVYSTIGTQLFDIGGAGATGVGGLRSPSSIALDSNGGIYVLDSGSRRVHVYDPDGKPLLVFPVSSGVPGGPWQPKSIAVDSAAHIYVTDSVHNKILVFDNAGRFLFTWGKTGSYLGDFWTPVSIFIDASDRIYIADQTNSRIQVYQFTK